VLPHGLVEAGGDHGHPDLAFHRRIVSRAEDNLGLVARGVVNNVADLRDFAQCQVLPTGNVE